MSSTVVRRTGLREGSDELRHTANGIVFLPHQHSGTAEGSRFVWAELNRREWAFPVDR